MTAAVVLFPIVALIGFAVGLTALGGFLIVPALAYLWPLPIDQAIATTLFATVPAPVLMLSLFRRQGLPIADGASDMLLAGAAGGIAGGASVSLLPAATLTLLLAVVVITASLMGLIEFGAVRAGRRPPRAPGAPGTRGRDAGPGLGRSARALVAGGSAALSATTGAGGPIISIPLMLALGVEVRRAIIASQWMMLAGTFAAVVVLLVEGRVRIGLGLATSAMAMGGIALGMQVARRLAGGTYRRIVAVTGLATGMWLLARAL
ncbi:MAG: sulfite exporter TauE/SafE family protein [Burkholderiales bacterium]|nr:MAG: sulfite exporter TauE/SafE family protein [Burkholderiales bacterium]